jgi:hypothetical protein
MFQQPADHDEVLLPGQRLVERGVLARKPDRRANLVGSRAPRRGRPARLARIGPQQRREDAHRGRLAGAIGAEHPEHRATASCEVDPRKRLRVAEALAQRSASMA